MLRRLLAVGVLTTLFLPAIELAACGDKFLRPGRSGRWQNVRRHASGGDPPLPVADREA